MLVGFTRLLEGIEQLRQYTEKEEDSFIELVRRAIQDRLTGQRPLNGYDLRDASHELSHIATSLAGIWFQLPTRFG